MFSVSGMGHGVLGGVWRAAYVLLEPARGVGIGGRSTGIDRDGGAWGGGGLSLVPRPRGMRKLRGPTGGKPSTGCACWGNRGIYILLRRKGGQDGSNGSSV